MQPLIKGYCLRSAWHKSSVVIKTVYVRRKSSRRVSAEEDKKAQGTVRGRTEYLLLLACLAAIGHLFLPPSQNQKGPEHTEYFKFQTISSMLPLERSDPWFNKHIPTSQRTNKHNYAHNNLQFGNHSPEKESLSQTPLGSAACKATLPPTKLFSKFRRKAFSNRKERKPW